MQLADLIDLVCGQHFRKHRVHSHFIGDHSGGPAVVPGQKDRLQAELVQARDGASGGRLQGVCHTDDAEHSDPAGAYVFTDPDDRLALSLECLRRFRYIGACDAVQERPAPDRDDPARDSGPYAEAGGRLELLRRHDVCPSLPGPLDDGSRNGVLGEVFDRRRETQQLDFGGAALVSVGHHVGHGHLALGQGAGLVQDDRIQPAGALEHVAALNQNPELRASAGPHHYGGRRGQAHGAGTSDDEHRHGCDQRVLEGVSRRQPSGQRKSRHAHDDGNEDSGDLVGKVLDRCLAHLGLLDQPCDLSEGRVRADAPGLDHNRARRVDGRAEDLVSWVLVHGHRLTGQHRFIDRGGSLAHDPVGRDLVTGAHPHEVAHHNLFRGDRHLDPVAQHPGLLGPKLEQALDGVRRPALGAVLEVLAEEQEGDDHTRRFEVDVTVGEQGIDRVAICREGAERDEGVHVRGSMLEVGPRASQKWPRGPELHRGDERPLDPAAPSLHRREHRDGDGRKRQHRGDHEPAPRRSGVVLLCPHRYPVVVAGVHVVRADVRNQLVAD